MSQVIRLPQALSVSPPSQIQPNPFIFAAEQVGEVGPLRNVFEVLFVHNNYDRSPILEYLQLLALRIRCPTFSRYPFS